MFYVAQLHLEYKWFQFKLALFRIFYPTLTVVIINFLIMINYTKIINKIEEEKNPSAPSSFLRNVTLNDQFHFVLSLLGILYGMGLFHFYVVL